ncbi:MAG: (Fe-S)-binding protein [Butyricicoccus sp.]
MDMQNVIYAGAVLFIMGIVFAILLGVAAKVFAVEVDERVPLVRECLPGANCGGCGFPGCDGLAAAIVEGRAPVNGCPVGGAAAAEKIAKVLGVEVAAGDRQVAHVYCNGGCNAKDKANYEGLQDCNAAMRVASGPKACSFGCMGLGSCVKACALTQSTLWTALQRLTPTSAACGKCVSTCPKKIINLVSEVGRLHVNCVNKDKGPEV